MPKPEVPKPKVPEPEVQPGKPPRKEPEITPTPSPNVEPRRTSPEVAPIPVTPEITPVPSPDVTPPGVTPDRPPEIPPLHDDTTRDRDLGNQGCEESVIKRDPRWNVTYAQVHSIRTSILFRNPMR